jgi:hypothetical protein
VIATSNKQVILETHIKLPPIYNEYTSHRAEAFGLLCAVQISQAINKYRITKNKFKTMNTTIICNNKTVIDTSIKLQKRRQIELKTIYTPDFDVFNTILAILHNIPRNKLILQHIKGHQKPTNNVLPYKAELNNMTDKLATAQALNMKPNKTTTIPQLLNAVLYIDGLPEL